MDSEDYLVSVTMLTYNHEKYVRQAIDSILMQQVDFNYEIVISDDASTDRTQDIIREYMLKYPDKIKAILRDVNVGVTRNSYHLKMTVQGKYIAYLEGDDFWTDKNKLQKQVDFLEKNPLYIGCASKLYKVDDEGLPIKTKYFPKSHYDKKYTMNDFMKGNTILLFQAGSLVHKNIFRGSKRDFTICYKAHPHIGDITSYSILLDLGDLYLFSEQMSAYRVKRESSAENVSSIAAKNPLESTRLTLKYADTLEEYFNNKYNMKFLRDVAVNFCLFNYKSLTSEEKKEFKKILNGLELSHRLACLLRYIKRNVRYYAFYLPKKILRW